MILQSPLIVLSFSSFKVALLKNLDKNVYLHSIGPQNNHNEKTLSLPYSFCKQNFAT